jgi:decaprenylphospho-beta-D-erythro-pentofuranosid-2-ulose 2-reductase
MGAELARQLARGGCKVALVARRADELTRLADAINTERGAGAALTYPHDVLQAECVPALFQQIAHDLGGLDLVIYASGVMPLLQPDEYDFSKDRAMVEVNVLGAIAWLNEAAQRFGRAGAGTLIGIGSVAGDRGRRGMPVYGATKAFLTTYLEALRNRIAHTGAVVVTVKPGPVATPLTAAMDPKKLPFLIPADKAATLILEGARARRNIVYVPGIWRPVMFLIRSFPSAIFRRLNI